jgi:hypothetical protein
MMCTAVCTVSSPDAHTHPAYSPLARAVLPCCPPLPLPQKEKVAAGDVIYIEANSGAVKRVGRCALQQLLLLRGAVWGGSRSSCIGKCSANRSAALQAAASTPTTPVPPFPPSPFCVHACAPSHLLAMCV